MSLADGAGYSETFELRYCPPFDFAALLEFFRARALRGVELVGGDRFARTFVESGVAGSVEVSHLPEAESLCVCIRAEARAVLPRILERVRFAFDVDRDVAALGANLSHDSLLAPLIAARPGLRVPGGWGGFELAVRAVLGQQVSVAAARQLGERLVRLCGTPLACAPALTLAFPTAEQVANADLSGLGAPRARLAALRALAQAKLADPMLFERGATLEATLSKLRAVRGIGDWTAHYIALRAAREPDAFPASDRGILRGAACGTDPPWTAESLARRAEGWRPWRAYAAQHLWAADAAASAASTLRRLGASRRRRPGATS